MGLGLVELAAVAEEMGRACMPGAFLSTLFAAALIDRAGSEQQRAKYLTPLVAGDLKATVAVLEESGSWDAGEVKVAATRMNGKLSVRKKLFVPDATGRHRDLCRSPGR